MPASSKVSVASKRESFPYWESWVTWKRRNPALSFTGEHVGSGMLSAIGSIIIYIAVFAFIYKHFAKRHSDKSENISAALQLRSPYMYKSMTQ